MKRLAASSLALLALALFASTAAVAEDRPHNVIIFVADGLRSHIVTRETAPALQAVREEGVDFRNSHSLYPTLTTPNASAIATGHRIGDTGNFGNVLYSGAPFPAPYISVVAAVEDDTVIALMNKRFEGNYFGEKTLLHAAAEAGYSTAVVGKLGPAALQDLTGLGGGTTLIIDDATGQKAEGGYVLPADVVAAIKAKGLDTVAPDRGLNASSGAYNMAGTLFSNAEQQTWFLGVATDVLLPRFKAAGKPFVMVYWSRDPDGTQHNQGDSLNSLVPGINGPTAMKGIRDASDNLAALRAALKAQGLDETTDIIVTADHGFSVISRESKTSYAATLAYREVKPGFLPPGFLAIDLAHALGLKLFDGAGFEIKAAEGEYPRRGGAVIGTDFAHPEIVVAANGGTDLLYFNGPDPKATAARVAEFLSTQDYTGAMFARDDLGAVKGALPSSLIGMDGAARTPRPSMFVAFRNFSTGCADEEICGADVSDTDLQQGQGMHGSFGRQDTHNFTAAIGPDFKAGFVDPAPVSNADLAPTAAKILGLDLGGRGSLKGRVMTEALKGSDKTPLVAAHVERSEPTANGFVTILNWQEADGRPYFDAAGAPGRAIGLKTDPLVK
jgi:hypothetical protein